VSQNYIRQVNVTNTRITTINVTNINVTNITYVNRNAMVAMPQNSFASAQPVQRAGVHVDANQIRQAQVVGTAPKVAPQRESVLANSGGRRAGTPPAAIANRPVVAKLAPPPRAVPFAAKQQMLQAHPGTPVAPAQLQALRSQAAQHPAPGRMQVQPINTQQVHRFTPTVHPGPAPTFAQRPAQPQPRSAQPTGKNPIAQPVPAAHPPNAPALHEQSQPPVRQTPQVHAQPQPTVHPTPAPREERQPAVHPTPPPHAQPQPTVREAPQVHGETPHAQPERRTPPPAPKPPPPKKEEKKKPEEKPSKDKDQ
jgi:hypothetical protein